MDPRKVVFSAISLFLSAVCMAAEMKNGGFEQTYIRDTSEDKIQAMIETGWKFRSPLVWPTHWKGSAGVSPVTFAVVQDNPHSGKNCILLWGQAGSSGYLSTQVKGLQKKIYKLSFFGRGRGTATLMFAGTHIILNAQMEDKWREYAGIYRNTTVPLAKEAVLTIQAQKGEVFFDDVAIAECNALEALIIEETPALEKSGKLLSARDRSDFSIYRENVLQVKRLLPRLKFYAKADPIPETMEVLRRLEEKVEELRKVAGAPTVKEANEALALAEIAKRLLRELEFEDAQE